MCGIGFFGPVLNPNKDKQLVVLMLKSLVNRGRDGFGFVVIHSEHGIIEHYRDFELGKVIDRLEHVKIPKGSYVLLHTRARPISELIHETEPTIDVLQPLVKHNIVVVFNGIIENDEEFREDEDIWVDTFAICKHHSKFIDKPLKGSYSYIYVNLKRPDEIRVVKGNQPLYAYENPKTKQIVVSSVPILSNDFYEFKLPVSSELCICIEKEYKFLLKTYKCQKYLSQIVIENSAPTPYPNTNTAVVLCSGGLDSCVVACEIAKICDNIVLLNFDYNQLAAKQEWNATQKLQKHLTKLYPNKRIEAVQLKIPFLEELAKSSSIFNSTPKGISAVETLSRWIPARNLIFLSIAVSFAESIGAGLIGYGGNLEEACVFPDNTTEAIEKLNEAIQWFISKPHIKIVNPVAYDMKVDIVKKAVEYDVYDIAWSCDLGGEEECGQCEGCILKRKALELSGTSFTTTGFC